MKKRPQMTDNSFNSLYIGKWKIDKLDPKADKNCQRCHGLGHYTALHVDEYTEEPVSMRCFCTKKEAI